MSPLGDMTNYNQFFLLTGTPRDYLAAWRDWRPREGCALPEAKQWSVRRLNLRLPHFKGEGHPKDREQGPASTGGEEEGAVNSVGDWNFKLDFPKVTQSFEVCQIRRLEREVRQY